MSKKLTITECQQLVISKDGLCLSTEYMSCRTPMMWQCTNGYKWTADFHSIKNCGTWCKICIGHGDISIEDCNNVATLHNGRCLSDLYVNNKIPLLWECHKGHRWKMTFNKVSYRQQWCPMCSLERARQTSITRYGVDNPMKHIDIARKSAAHRVRSTSIHWYNGEVLECSSSWELKVVEHLNNKKIMYLWQPRTFTLNDGRTYRPDLYLVDSDTWVEIKGRWYPKSKEKWEEFVLMPIKTELWDKNKLCKLGIKIK